jgi:hypothetical protein
MLVYFYNHKIAFLFILPILLQFMNTYFFNLQLLILNLLFYFIFYA